MSRAKGIKKGWFASIKNWVTTEKAPIPEFFRNVEREAAAPLALKLALGGNRPLLLSAPILIDAERIFSETVLWIKTLELDINVSFLPEVSSGIRFMPGAEPERAKTLFDAFSGNSGIIISSAAGFLSPTLPPEKIILSQLEVHRGMKYPFQKLLRSLVELDYDDEFEVSAPGEFSKRGGIIDVFSPSAAHPVRIEFWGDEVESIREFSSETQRSLREVDSCRIIRRAAMPGENADEIPFIECMKGKFALFAALFPQQTKAHIEKFSSPEDIGKWDRLMETGKSGKIIKLLDSVESALASENSPVSPCFPSAAHLCCELPDESAAGAGEIMRQLTADQVRQWVSTGYKAALLGTNEASEAHIIKWCAEHKLDASSVETGKAELPYGMIFPIEKIVFLTEREIFYSAAALKKRPEILIDIAPDKEKATEAPLQQFADIEEGDTVVHLIHGIGIYKGIREIKTMGALQEVIVMEFAEEKKMYIPLLQANMITRYIGPGKSDMRLSHVGSRHWDRAKLAASRSVRDLALEMIKIQAMRATASGFAFPEDDIWQKMFESAFPYEDTPDQIKASREIKGDMMRPDPMDRLLCGDVGYGKTEVAIRAAFKCVSAGRQAAVLVPTTILAQQHFYSFSERFAEYPIIIETLSRFKSPAEQRDIIKRLAEGKVDIVIGTHRLVQGDVTFSNLGLVVIDEEQRFGVEHKEKFKKLRATVDILTMTATPIPRTLYMSMAGMRDLSTIMTAPGKRLPVQTIVSRYDEALIVSAIQNEISRGGQAFYLHNRVKSIEETCDNLRRLMPDVRFETAHGKMDEDELELVMSEFISGSIDVLVSTTIIESGLDIPNANTIIIERCDRFGLAELYQLRGRIGRWKNQAYAYLLLPEHDIITSDARKRIAAIRRYTQLGAGFKLALRDLEIRGSGNLLGQEQSGHINAIGFELYCQILRVTVAQLKGEKNLEFLPEVDIAIDFISYGHKAPPGKIPVCIPPEYISSERLRLEAYRQMCSASKHSEIEELLSELKDRYGSIPRETLNMAALMKIKICTARAGFKSLKVSEGRVLLENISGILKPDGKIPHLTPSSAESPNLETLLALIQKITAS